MHEVIQVRIFKSDQKKKESILVRERDTNIRLIKHLQLSKQNIFFFEKEKDQNSCVLFFHVLIEMIEGAY